MYVLRSILVDLNFPMVKHLVKGLDDTIQVSKTIELVPDELSQDENSLNFVVSRTDRVMYDLASDKMRLLRAIFWDEN